MSIAKYYCLECKGTGATEHGFMDCVPCHGLGIVPDPFAVLVLEQQEFSEKTFGPGKRTLGMIDHIMKELAEIRDNPDDLTEYIDVMLLAIDGYWRHGGKSDELWPRLRAKLAKNKARKWPAPKDENSAVEHDRQEEA